MAAQRLVGFGGEVAVISPETVRTALIATARELLARYDQFPWCRLPIDCGAKAEEREIILPGWRFSC